MEKDDWNRRRGSPRGSNRLVLERHDHVDSVADELPGANEQRGTGEEGTLNMAHKKAGSSSKNGRDSVGQRLGVKVGDGVLVGAGAIIVRQRGMTFLSGDGTGLGRDYTIFATVPGRVRFEHQTKDKKRIRVEAEAS